MKRSLGFVLAVGFVVAMVGCAVEMNGGSRRPPREDRLPPTAAIDNERYCTELTQGYCARCGGASPSCFSQGYAHCMGAAAPTDTAHLAYGPTRTCARAIAAGDCRALQAGYYPPVCDIPPPASSTPPLPSTSVAPTATASAPPPPAQKPVTLGEICPEMMQDMCNRCQPTHMPDCVKNSLAWCYTSRPPETPTAMSPAQAKKCERAYKALTCDAIATSYVPVECQGLR